MYRAQTRIVRGGVTHAVADQQAMGLLSQMVRNQARVMAYLDAFWVFSIIGIARACPWSCSLKKSVAAGTARRSIDRRRATGSGSPARLGRLPRDLVH